MTTIHPADLCGCGIAATDQILKGLGLPTSKALNPLVRRDFIVIAGRLSRTLRAAGGAETVALGRALETLDVDWAKMTSVQRDKTILAARSAIRRSIPDATAGVVGELETEIPIIAESTRTGLVRRHRFSIEANFSTSDRRSLDFAAQSQSNFVSNSIGQRADVTARHARAIVSDGLRRGSGRSEIAGQLQRGLERSHLKRQRNYYDVVAGSMANRSRTFGQMASLRDAGIQEYIIEAVLDEATSDICRMMHGKRFSVREGLGLFEQVEGLSDPQQIKDVDPWVRTRTAEDGSQSLEYQSSGKTHTVASVVESGVGVADEKGKFSGELTNGQLKNAGIMKPPFHALCRTTVVPDL